MQLTLGNISGRRSMHARG